MKAPRFREQGHGGRGERPTHLRMWLIGGVLLALSALMQWALVQAVWRAPRL